MTVTHARRLPGMPAADPAAQRWLVFVHQLPAHPSNARVKTWRRLRQIGAVAVKHSVYVLPNTAQSREDFEWLGTEVTSLGGQANIFEASSINGMEERQIISQFRAARAEDFSKLSKDIKAWRAKVRHRSRTDEEGLRAIRGLRDRFAELRRLDFFTAPGGSEAEAALRELDSQIRRSPNADARVEAKSL